MYKPVRIPIDQHRPHGCHSIFSSAPPWCLRSLSQTIRRSSSSLAPNVDDPSNAALKLSNGDGEIKAFHDDFPWFFKNHDVLFIHYKYSGGLESMKSGREGCSRFKVMKLKYYRPECFWNIIEIDSIYIYVQLYTYVTCIYILNFGLGSVTHGHGVTWT